MRFFNEKDINACLTDGKVGAIFRLMIGFMKAIQHFYSSSYNISTKFGTRKKGKQEIVLVYLGNSSYICSIKDGLW